jgi:hypothetical protein
MAHSFKMQELLRAFLLLLELSRLLLCSAVCISFGVLVATGAEADGWTLYRLRDVVPPQRLPMPLALHRSCVLCHLRLPLK